MEFINQVKGSKGPVIEDEEFRISDPQILSCSALWEMQRNYFFAKGVGAWQKNEVPHYISNNPLLANSYAEIVLAFWKDRQRLVAEESLSQQPLYICELGAGSGRFAYHFLSRLKSLCKEQAVPLDAFFKYVITDIAQSNINFWMEHPRFFPFFEMGVLDVALFDAEESNALKLQRSGRTIGRGCLDSPLVVLANYVFDSIPQDIFYFNKKKCYLGRITLFSDRNPEEVQQLFELLPHIHYQLDFVELSGQIYSEPILNDLLEHFRQSLSNTYITFPIAGLECLNRLKEFSRQGTLLLSADKGEHRPLHLEGEAPPVLVLHGSFSTPVNFHVFGEYCKRFGGITMFPAVADNLNVSGFLMMERAEYHRETLEAYNKCVNEFGPDDYFTFTREIEHKIGDMSLEEILFLLKRVHYDSRLLSYSLPRLNVLVPHLSSSQREQLCEAIDLTWGMYFPIGEEQDLAYEIGTLLYGMNCYAQALTYFGFSMKRYGQYTGTLYNMASCYHMLGKSEEVDVLLRKVLKHDPENQDAKTLLAEYE